MSTENGPRHVDIEAGHYYAGERVYKGYPGMHYPNGGPGEVVVGPHILGGIQIAQRIITSLENTGFTAGRSVFVDDTALMSYWRGKQDKGLFEARVVGVTSQQIYDSGFRPFVQFKESELESPARDLVTDIQERVAVSEHYGLSSDRRKIKYKEQGKVQSVTLLGKNNEPFDPDYPSCEILDLILYRKRLLLAPVVVTVLPESYKPQQERVKKLFEILGEKPAVVVVYFNGEGAVTEAESWSKASEEIADTISSIA